MSSQSIQTAIQDYYDKTGEYPSVLIGEPAHVRRLGRLGRIREPNTVVLAHEDEDGMGLWSEIDIEIGREIEPPQSQSQSQHRHHNVIPLFTPRP